MTEHAERLMACEVVRALSHTQTHTVSSVFLEKARELSAVCDVSRGTTAKSKQCSHITHLTSE